MIGGAAGITGAVLVTGAAALYAAASGDSVSLTELGSGLLDVAAMTGPNAALAGAVAGAGAVGLGGTERSVRNTAMVAGATVGVATLGFAVYEAIQVLQGGILG